MGRIVLIAVIAATVIQCYGAFQVQMPDHAELQQPEDDLQTQIRELQKNVTSIWTYIQDLRSAVSQHLTHLRQHQVELESSMHRMEHTHDATTDLNMHGDHGDSHHHSGEQHSHGDSHDSHSHGSDSHSHGSDSHSHGSDSHSHGSDSHSHGSDSHSHGSDSHSHSGEHHSHSGEHHSHSGEQHSHSGEQGHHSHSSHDHSKEDDSHSHSHDHGSMSSSSHSHSHGSDHSHDHKDSHETEDLEQGIQQIATDVGPAVAEPVVTATTRQEHYHHHHNDRGQARSSSGSRSNAMDLMNENTFHHRYHGHHHSDSGSRSSKNRTVELPKYTDYNMYDFALCTVQPNRAIPEDQQQNVGGQVTLWQKKSGGPLNLHVRLQGFQMGDHHGHHQAMQQEQDNETPQEEVVHKHGFHIHATGNLSNGCQSTGPHYNPKGVNHGGPTSLIRHVGDLGNIECDNNGVADLLFSDDMASLRGQYSIIGKAMVVHSNPDDFGQGDNEESLKTGNAGIRIACCVIQHVDKLNIRYYRAMKTATQYQNY